MLVAVHFLCVALIDSTNWRQSVYNCILFFYSLSKLAGTTMCKYLLCECWLWEDVLNSLLCSSSGECWTIGGGWAQVSLEGCTFFRRESTLLYVQLLLLLLTAKNSNWKISTFWSLTIILVFSFFPMKSSSFFPRTISLPENHNEATSSSRTARDACKRVHNKV